MHDGEGGRGGGCCGPGSGWSGWPGWLQRETKAQRLRAHFGRQPMIGGAQSKSYFESWKRSAGRFSLDYLMATPSHELARTDRTGFHSESARRGPFDLLGSSLSALFCLPKNCYCTEVLYCSGRLYSRLPILGEDQSLLSSLSSSSSSSPSSSAPLRPPRSRP